jgi:para-nitrobenzyl esterase
VVETVVRTAQGGAQGRAVEDAVAFLGIPYAAAPVGEHRFRPAAPPPSWEGVRDATEHGPTAPMPGYPWPFDALLPNPVVPGEEYLTVNVWTPDPGAGGLPVLVWIHGGAFVNGSNSVPIYDGSRFARDGVVLVSVNYRLGVEGFALLPDAVPNLGLLDQVAALQWVQDNVAAFGGDPGAVTVAGESAGAMSIGALLAMPRARGLFRRAVLQSGAAHHVLSAPTASRVAGYLAEELGVPPTREGLAALPAAELVRGQKALSAQFQASPDPARWGEIVANLMVFEPVVDGEVLPGPPIERIAAGAAADVEVLVGTNRHEHRFFLVPNGLIDLVGEPAPEAVAAGYRLPPGGLDRYRAANPDAAPGELLAEVMTDFFYRIPAVRLAEAQPGSRIYEFDWPSPAYGGRLQSCHALELPFVFDTLDAAGAAAMGGERPPQQLADAMHRAWVAFAASGDPGWPAYTLDRRPVRRFGETVETVEDPRGELRALWAGIR